MGVEYSLESLGQMLPQSDAALIRLQDFFLRNWWVFFFYKADAIPNIFQNVAHKMQSESW